MTEIVKAQRVRDPLHNLIEFGGTEIEHTLWQVIQTPPFQRLRRIRQLAFSEFVFPGATHTRFAHSIGVFHTARQLVHVIRRAISDGEDRVFRDQKAQIALAAALVHDVGHGMFSHAFEEIGRELSLPMAHHETVSEALIRDSEISHALRELGSGFANDVADVVRSKSPGSLYASVVSSQFDADRLDYMQRDRLMTGVHSSGIDATWLMANLEIASVPTGADQDASGTVETLVLGPKAFRAAENYVLALFQLYPNVYLHKTTRAAEKLFSALMLRLIALVRDGYGDRTGLPGSHPIRRFASDPDRLDHALALDDTVFWGALPMMAEADDPFIRDCALRLRERRLPKCIDVRQAVEEHHPLEPGMSAGDRTARDARVRLVCKEVLARVQAFAASRRPDGPAILVDEARRTPYKRFQDSQTPLNQILIRLHEHGQRIDDLAQFSSVVASAEAFEVFRVYLMADDTDGRSEVENIIKTELTQGRDHGAV